jgi:hypothetical protein
VASTGHFELDVTFSDHRMSRKNLEHFGGVVRTIHSTGADDETRHWAFLVHVSEHYPELLTVNPPSEQRERAEAVLERIEIPTTELELKSLRRRWLPQSDSWWGGVLLVGAGALVVLGGLGIETYELPWYGDVRVILAVGFGAILVAGGLQSLWEVWARAAKRGEAL